MGEGIRDHIVGLQLDPDLELIALGLVHAALQLLNPGQDPQQVLHVVADLVRDHVGLGECRKSSTISESS
jgi:hypothetical protein